MWQHRIEKTVDIAQGAAAIGALIVAILFLGYLASWSFARGLVSALGFPAQIANIRSSFDMFPSVAAQGAGAFSLSFALGFANTEYDEKRHHQRRMVSVLALAVFMVLATWSSTKDQPSGLLDGALLLASLVGPFLVGYSFHSLRSTKYRYFVCIMLFFLVLEVCQRQWYGFGWKTAITVSHSAGPVFPWTERGMAAIKQSDFPIISIRTRVKVLSRTPNARDGDVYIYAPERPGFLRLVLQDESNYYLIAYENGTALPSSISKASVVEMQFPVIPSQQ
jgi:hypothetical protein